MLENFGKLIAYENGELDEHEAIQFFQSLLDSGMIDQLQGSYGHTAQALINAGLIHHK